MLVLLDSYSCGFLAHCCEMPCGGCGGGGGDGCGGGDGGGGGGSAAVIHETTC